jgi:microcystin-dependent protein
MSTLTTLNGSDLITNDRAVINDNFSALNSEKIETSVLDTDSTLAANSDAKIATQKAVKAYMDNTGNSFAPTGAVSAFAGSTAPTGWLLADGSAVSRTTYATLFGVISTTYGSGNGTTTFNVPDLKGKIPVGYSSTETEFDALGETGGAKTHALTEAELAAHTHTIVTYNPGTAGSQGVSGAFNTSSPGSKTSNSTGSGTAHNNLQPYVTLNYIIKT